MPVVPDLSGIRDLNERLGLFATLDEAVLEAELSRALPPGPLLGQLVGLKANIALQGARWSAGLPHRSEMVAEFDANVTRRLRQAGARLMAGLNMDAAALGGVTDNPDFGRTENPSVTGHSTGGSSGGAAAAVASGLVDMALGTDTLGSIRIPASYCGVYGMKPTFGLIGRSGIVPLAPSLDVVGPVTVRADHIWSLLETLAGLDDGDADSRPAPAGWAEGVSNTQTAGIKIGLPDAIAEVSSETEVLKALTRAADILSGLGARVGPAAMPGWRPSMLRRKAFLLTECEGATVYEDELNEGGILPEAVEPLLLYGRGLSSGKLMAVMDEVRAARAQLDRTFAEVDLLLMPTTPQRAFAAGMPAPANQADFTSLANVAGVPALAVPVLVPEDPLPGSVQLVGPAWSEPLLVCVAMAIENALKA